MFITGHTDVLFTFLFDESSRLCCTASFCSPTCLFVEFLGTHLLPGNLSVSQTRQWKGWWNIIIWPESLKGKGHPMCHLPFDMLIFSTVNYVVATHFFSPQSLGKIPFWRAYCSTALGIQSPSENGTGALIPFWGGDYTPQSSSDKVIGSLGLGWNHQFVWKVCLFVGSFSDEKAQFLHTLKDLGM